MMYGLQDSIGYVADCLASTLTSITVLFSQRGSSAAVISAMLDALDDVLTQTFTLSSLSTPTSVTKVCVQTSWAVLLSIFERDKCAELQFVLLLTVV